MLNQKQLASKLRVWHRRLGIIVGIQFLLWTIGGIYFSWTEIGNIRGQDEKSALPPPVLAVAGVDFKSLSGILSDSNQLPVLSVNIHTIHNMTVYRVSYNNDTTALFDAKTGNRLSPISKEQAITIARQDFIPDSPISQVILVEKQGGEYKGPVPAWRIDFDNWKQTHIYIDASTAQVTARRNQLWRVFDFLWMLHILDFDERDNINNWILRLMSAAGLITLLSGYLLWYLTYRIRKANAK